MELKYYLRGLGLGIVVTAIIMGITSSRSKAMTDDEIIARAKQLGMTENRVLTDAASDDADPQGGESENDGTDMPEKETSTGGEAVELPGKESEQNAPEENNPEENAAPDADTGSDGAPEPILPDENAASVPDDSETGEETQEPLAAQDDAEVQDAQQQDANVQMGPEDSSGVPALITIGNGDGSYTVSRKLEDAGIVESASAFDTFLCENGYDKKIRAGNYTIPPDADNEQIARMITGQQP